MFFSLISNCAEKLYSLSSYMTKFEGTWHRFFREWELWNLSPKVHPLLFPMILHFNQHKYSLL